MNRRSFFEAALAAVGSLPLLGSLVPKREPATKPWCHAGVDMADGDSYTSCIITGYNPDTQRITIAGEFIPGGCPVTFGEDGNVYRMDTGRVDSEGNALKEWRVDYPPHPSMNSGAQH